MKQTEVESRLRYTEPWAGRNDSERVERKGLQAVAVRLQRTILFSFSKVARKRRATYAPSTNDATPTVNCQLPVVFLFQ